MPQEKAAKKPITLLYTRPDPRLAGEERVLAFPTATWTIYPKSTDGGLRGFLVWVVPSCAVTPSLSPHGSQVCALQAGAARPPLWLLCSQGTGEVIQVEGVTGKLEGLRKC